MKFENVIKSVFTTLLGCVMMGVGFYGWYTDNLTDWQAVGSGVAGFALLFMRDQIPDFIRRVFNKKLGDQEEPKP
jgi:TRAP-type uncharacterized transport system fused permease subunit